MPIGTEHIENNILYLELNGRIDSSNAEQAEEMIGAIKRLPPGVHSVPAVGNLEYLSSAGLRVILRMRRDTADLKIINVNSEVYEIFDMIGFAEMLTVEEAFRCIMKRSGNNFYNTTAADRPEFEFELDAALKRCTYGKEKKICR